VYFKTCLWGRLLGSHSRLIPVSHSSAWLEFRTWLFSCWPCVLLGYLLRVFSPRGPPNKWSRFGSCCSRWVPSLLSLFYRGYRLLKVFTVKHPGATSFLVGTYHAFGIEPRKGYGLKGSLQIIWVPRSMVRQPTCRRQWGQ